VTGGSGGRTQLARRTLLAHLARLIDVGLLIRVHRGRHTSLVEQLHTGRARNAAVYRLLVCCGVGLLNWIKVGVAPVQRSASALGRHRGAGAAATSAGRRCS